MKLILIILFLFISLILSSIATNSTNIVTCLMNYNVSNFSVYKTGDDGSYYSNLLDFSIQNLRFAESFMPKPMVIIVPESKEQLVSSVMCCIRSSYEIRVRCGGHSYEGTSSVTLEGGSSFVIIDLMKLDDVSLDLESGTAWVQGGATLGQTYYAISRASNVHGFAAGSCPTVGVGGHISGGGFGFLSRKYGLAADNVVDALLVDAEGRILDRESMGEDVYWAIRGGGGGIWGVIYAWKIQLLKVPKIVTSFILSRPGSKRNVSQLVHKWQLVAPKLDDEFYLSVSIRGIASRGIHEMNAQFNGFYLGPRTKAISVLSNAFPELSIQKHDFKEMSWIKSILFFSELDNTSNVSLLKQRYFEKKSYFKAKSDYVKTPISMDGIMTTLDVLEKEPKGHIILDPYGGVMERISEDAIAFPHRKGNLFGIQYLVEWGKKDNSITKSNAYIEWIREFYNTMAPFVSSAPRAAYVNYIDLDLGVMDNLLINTNAGHAMERARVWGQKYFLNNYDRLVKAKTIIDPLNVFRHQQGIPPMFATIQERNYSIE
ncbi:reticuline oxidase-like [Solanum stenotomum]|uniref:reticuline oxidase-like n=1 Tax=Solanum stenotomum TaxID=172797 RepID=UPI0020D0E703|nr:reticuline oxidase-like [Solanum stenotomum]